MRDSVRRSAPAELPRCQAADGTYRLTGTYPAWGLSGATWWLYRRA